MQDVVLALPITLSFRPAFGTERYADALCCTKFISGRYPRDRKKHCHCVPKYKPRERILRVRVAHVSTCDTNSTIGLVWRNGPEVGFALAEKDPLLTANPGLYTVLTAAPGKNSPYPPGESFSFAGLYFAVSKLTGLAKGMST